MKSAPQRFQKNNSTPRPQSPAFALRPIACCVMLACCDSAWANPTGPQVINGAANIQGLGSKNLNVTNSPGAIIHWQGFSIGANEVTRFTQQSASSAVLNRVVGADISQIHGQLLSNGRVFLINPAGILIGAGAVIDTAGFVGSTLRMLDADFLAGRLKFQGDGSSGSIVNQGWIKAGQGGNIVLVAPHIENSGVLQTEGGQLILAAGQKLTIGHRDLEGVQFEIQAPTDSAINVGKLLADGGAVGVFAGTLKHSGDIRANALARDEAGRIVLKAQGDLTVAAGSTITANGKVGGNIVIHSGSADTLVAGAVAATGSAGAGGDIQVLGNRVAVFDKAAIDASGAAGGGQIRVGGDYQGKNPAVQNASHTVVGPGATLRADALTSGNGGKVIVWADDMTRYYGNISARGGEQAGDGGFVEVSGKRFLDFNGRVDTRAPNGKAGTLLLDPTSISIVATDTAAPNTELTVDCSGDRIFQETGTPDAASEITVAALLGALSNGNVVINTSSTAAGTGDITFNTAFDFDTMRGANTAVTRTLTLNAFRDVNISNQIFDSVAGGETLNLVLNAARASNITANIALGGGLLDANTAGSRVVNMNGGSPVISNVSSFDVGTLNLGGAAASFNSPTNVATALNISAGTANVNTDSTVAGILNLSGGTLTVNGPLSANSLAISGGTASLNANTTVAGALTVSGGTLQGAGAVAANGGLTFTGGTIAGAGGVTVPGTTSVNTGAPRITGTLVTSGFSMTGGTLDITGTGVLNLTGAGAKTIAMATLNNAGSVNLGGTANLVLNDNARLNNTGIFNFQADVGVQYTTGTVATRPVFDNSGTLRKSGGTGTSTIGITIPIDFTNSGTLDAQTGTINYASNNTFNDGTQFSGAGSNLVTTNSTFNGTITSGNLTLASGNFAGTANLAGTTAWTGGTITGGFTVPNGATLNLTGGSSKSVSGGTLTNAGTMNLAGTGNLLLNGGAVSNTGIFDIQSDAGVQHTAGATVLSNAGTLRKSAGTGTSVIGISNPVPFNNEATGTIHVQAGTLQVNGGFPGNTGTINVDAGATFSTNGAALLNAGTVSGKGTVNLGGATFVNGGTVSPGTSPGTLVINGNYVQTPAGVLVIEIGGTQQGVSYDLLQVSGNATLEGTLAVSTSGGFNPAPGDAFTFLTYSSRSGNFATPGFPPGSSFQLAPGLTSYAVTSTGSSPSPSPSPSSPSGNLDTARNRPSEEIIALRDRLEDTLSSRDEETERNRARTGPLCN